jgi:uncharacterized protein (UPF0332 family)
MTFVWSDFLLLAKALQSNTEAECRTAIGRAYYAVFCSAREFLITHGFEIPRTADDHKLVREYFELSGDFDSTRIAADLDRLRIMRNNADYDNVFTGNPSDAKSIAIVKAEKSLQRLNEFSEKVVDEIRENLVKGKR